METLRENSGVQQGREGNRIKEWRSDSRSKRSETYTVMLKHSEHQIKENTDLWISKQRKIIMDKERYYIMIKKSIPQEKITILKVCAPNNRAKYK